MMNLESPLLRSSDLPIATPVDLRHEQAMVLINALYTLGVDYCDQENSQYGMLALNQVSQDVAFRELIKARGSDIKLANRAIYVSTRFGEDVEVLDEAVYSGCLLINPRDISTKEGETIIPEGCGSIFPDSIRMLIKRPIEITMVVDIYDGCNLVKNLNITMMGIQAGIFSHELDHLSGFAAGGEGHGLLVDPQPYLNGSKEISKENQAIFLGMKKNSNKLWLDINEGEWFLYNSEGELVWQGQQTDLNQDVIEELGSKA
jgi:hypothetical protein